MNPVFQDPIWQEENRQVAEGAPQAMPLAKQYSVMIFWGTNVFFGDDTFQNFRQKFGDRNDVFSPSEQMQQVTGNNGGILKLAGWKEPYPHGDFLLIDETRRGTSGC